MSCCFHFSRCTTACWRGPARSGWSCGGCPRSWNDRVYTWAASLLFILVCSVWQAVPGTLYVLHGFWRALGYVVQLAGLVLTIRSSAALDVLDLAGVRQVQRASLGTPPRHVGLETTGLYGFVRHPLYFAWALMVFASPDMTATRATFAIVTTLYLAIAIPWEERSLVQIFGRDYEVYCQQVRWRMFPGVYLEVIWESGGSKMIMKLSATLQLTAFDYTAIENA